MAEALTLDAAFFTMLTYTSPFVFASPVNCDAAAEISSATEDAASVAAAQQQQIGSSGTFQEGSCNFCKGPALVSRVAANMHLLYMCW